MTSPFFPNFARTWLTFVEFFIDFSLTSMPSPRLSDPGDGADAVGHRHNASPTVSIVQSTAE